MSNPTPNPPTPRRVAVIYHYFAHYRDPVIRELISGSAHTYEFLGDTHSFGSGIKLTEIPAARFRRARCVLLGPLMFQWGAIRAALSWRYDTLILLGNCKWPTMWVAAIIGRLLGKRVLFWTHGWLERETGMKALFRNTFYRLGHGILLYGHRAKCIGIDMGFNPSRLHVIYNSLDCELQDRTRASFAPDERERTRAELFPEHAQRPILINVTRLHPYKKLDQLIKAAAMLAERGTPVNVLIIGDGPHRPELERLTAELGVNARFTGALYEEHEIGRMLNASDLAVMPGPIGLLAMHALAYGVPVVSHNDFDQQMPEFESIIEGETGGFFPPDNLEALADVIVSLLSIERTPEQRTIKARELIERFYNPISQRILIDRAVEGDQADDLFNAGISRYRDEDTACD